MRHARARDCRAYMTADAIAGLFLLAALATSLVVAITGRQRASRQIAEARQAQIIAEAALACLQRGATVQPPGLEQTIDVRRIKVVDGVDWIEVRATHSGRSAIISGVANIKTPQEGVGRAK